VRVPMSQPIITKSRVVDNSTVINLLLLASGIWDVLLLDVGEER
jgi:hypothetical protein